MKNILVPTDFSLQSLSVVHDIMSNEKERVNILFFHMVLMPNDLSDLLYLRKSHLHAQVPQSFTEAVQLLQNKYRKQVEKIAFNFYYGCTTAVVNSIIESNNIDKVYLLANYQYKLHFRSSVKMFSLIEKSKLPAQMVYLKARVFKPSQAEAFSALLISQQDEVKYSQQPAEEVYN